MFLISCGGRENECSAASAAGLVLEAQAAGISSCKL
jgi:hypothetical protein